MMAAIDRIQFIKNWIKNYCNSMEKKPDCLVVRVSSVIDSAVVSTISAMTEMRVKALSMPIRHTKFQDDLSRAHFKWLKSKFFNVEEIIINLDEVFNNFEKSLKDFNDEYTFANSREGLRMATLYQVAGANNIIVVSTSNKVEDFGVGFYTKYGDGGIDISPISDFLKSQVWEMGKELKILESILKAPPTDGLSADGRTNERQLGMSFEDLERAMLDPKDKNYEKYLKIRKRNLHKMNQIPIWKFKNDE
jgi:NAD+ synthase